MSGVRLIVDIDPNGTSVSGQVATGRTDAVSFSGWLELMQTLERAVSEVQPPEEGHTESMKGGLK